MPVKAFFIVLQVAHCIALGCTVALRSAHQQGYLMASHGSAVKALLTQAAAQSANTYPAQLVVLRHKTTVSQTLRTNTCDTQARLHQALHSIISTETLLFCFYHGEITDLPEFYFLPLCDLF